MKIQYFLRYEERKICECRFEGDGENSYRVWWCLIKNNLCYKTLLSRYFQNIYLRENAS